MLTTFFLVFSLPTLFLSSSRFRVKLAMYYVSVCLMYMCTQLRPEGVLQCTRI